MAKVAPVEVAVSPAMPAPSSAFSVAPTQTVHLASTVPACIGGPSYDGPGFWEPESSARWCKVDWGKMEPCQKQDYFRVRDLDESAWRAEESRRISVGGYLRQEPSAHQCSYEESPTKRRDGCDFCMRHLRFVDFTEDETEPCKYLYFSNYDSSGFLRSFSVDSREEVVCLMFHRAEKVIIDADIYKDYRGYLSFFDIHSICKLP